MTNLQNAFTQRGITLRDAFRRGVPYHRMIKHWHGQRTISAESAVMYEEVLGIPRSELRPDLWPWPKEEPDETDT